MPESTRGPESTQVTEMWPESTQVGEGSEKVFRFDRRSRMNRQLWVVAILVAVVVVVVVLMGLDVLGCGPGPDGDVMQMALCVWMTARADGGLSVFGNGAWFEGGGKIFMPVTLQSRCLDWPCPGPAPVEPSPEE